MALMQSGLLFGENCYPVGLQMKTICRIWTNAALFTI